MDLATTIPFENSIDTFEFPGKHLKELFEFAVAKTWQSNDQLDMTFLTHVSGNFRLFDSFQSALFQDLCEFHCRS